MLIKKEPIRKSNFATRKLIKKSRFARPDSHELESLANKVADSFAEMLDKHNEYTDVDKDVISNYKHYEGFIPFGTFQADVETAFCPLAQELDFKYISGNPKDFKEAVENYNHIAEYDLEMAEDEDDAYENASFVWLGLNARIEGAEHKQRSGADTCKVTGFLRFDNDHHKEWFYEKDIELTDDEDVDLANIEKAAHEALKSMGLE